MMWPLSRYLARANAGERIIITARGERVAELVPVGTELRTLTQLAQQGRVSWSGRRPVLRPAFDYTGPGVSDAVLEQRAELNDAATAEGLAVLGPGSDPQSR
jgi:antitoxin (DNA-binding transcriptional repressor) of toxin-antitoxin stability system